MAASTSSFAKEVDCLHDYSRWGGLPAIIASADDFQAARQNDAAIGAMFSKLDSLDRCQGPNVIDVARALKDCFTAEEVDRMNSPLLDGLLLAVSGVPANKHTNGASIINLPGDISVVLRRLISRRRCFIDAMEWLLTRCADLRDDVGPALVRAAATGQTAAVSLLMKHRCPVHPYRNCAIDLAAAAASAAAAAANGHLDAVRLLVTKADNRSLRLAKVTSDAAANGHQAVIEYILTECDPLLAKTTALTFIAKRGQLLMLELVKRVHTSLFESAAEWDEFWTLAIRAALTHTRFRMLRELLQPGLRGNYTAAAYEDGYEPELPTLVARHGSIAELRLLNDSGLWAALSEGVNEALAISTERGDIEMVTSWLRDHGANPRSDDDLPFYLAAAAGSAPMMQLLCDAANVSFDALVPNGDLVSYLKSRRCCRCPAVAVKTAFRHRHMAALRSLFDLGFPGRDEAIELMVELGCTDLLRDVFDARPPVQFGLYSREVDAVCNTARRGDLDTLALVLARCPCFFDGYRSARRILCAAVDSDCLPLLDLLWARLKTEAHRLRIVDDEPVLSLRDLWITLYRAAATGSLPVCHTVLQMLVEHSPDDASVQRCNQLGGKSSSVTASPVPELDFVALMRWVADVDHLAIDVEIEASMLPVAARHGQLEVCEYLLDRGVDVQTQDNEALKLAHRNGHPAVVQLLLANGAHRAAIFEEESLS